MAVSHENVLAHPLRSPSEGPRWLGLWVLGILVLGWLGMMLVQQALVFVLSAARIGAIAELAGDPAVLGVTQLLGLLPAIHVAFRLAPRQPRPKGAPPITPLVLGAVLLAGSSLQFVLGAFSTALADVLPVLALDPADMARMEAAMRVETYADALAIPFCVVFVAPLTEELLFRGAIQPLLVTRYGFKVGWVATALLFGAFHVQPFAILYASLAGLVLGAVAHRSHSILPSFALHAAFNAIPIVLPEAIVPIPGFNSGDASARIPLLVALSANLISLGALLAFAHLTERAPTRLRAVRQRTGPRASG